MNANIQATVDMLNRRIGELAAARDALLTLNRDGTFIPVRGAQKKKPNVSSARSAAQRKRWAEQKRKQRALAKAKTARKKATAKPKGQPAQ